MIILGLIVVAAIGAGAVYGLIQLATNRDLNDK